MNNALILQSFIHVCLVKNLDSSINQVCIYQQYPSIINHYGI